MGLTHTSTCVVGEDLTAIKMGSGELPLLSISALAALMENAAMLAITSSIAKDTASAKELTTVGAYLEIKHLKPSKIGETISATAELILLEGKKYTFAIQARDSSGNIVGTAEHVRLLVNREDFMKSV